MENSEKELIVKHIKLKHIDLVFDFGDSIRVEGKDLDIKKDADIINRLLKINYDNYLLNIVKNAKENN